MGSPKMIGEVRFRLAAIAIVVSVVPAVLSAQVGEIKGVARDAAGAPRAGVVVEAESSSLIEKKLTTTTDKDGTYQFKAIPIGPYSVTFRLMGFVTHRHERIQLTSGFIRLIDAQMKAGLPSEIFVVKDPEPVIKVFHVR